MQHLPLGPHVCFFPSHFFDSFIIYGWWTCCWTCFLISWPLIMHSNVLIIERWPLTSPTTFCDLSKLSSLDREVTAHSSCNPFNVKQLNGHDSVGCQQRKRIKHKICFMVGFISNCSKFFICSKAAQISYFKSKPNLISTYLISNLNLIFSSTCWSHFYWNAVLSSQPLWANLFVLYERLGQSWQLHKAIFSFGGIRLSYWKLSERIWKLSGDPADQTTFSSALKVWVENTGTREKSNHADLTALKWIMIVKLTYPWLFVWC